MHGVEIDWEKRDWKRIYTPDEQRERLEKLMRLIGGPDSSKLLAASTTKTKPTVRIKR